MAIHDYIWHINSANPPQQVIPNFPLADEELFEIDLNTRIIKGPEWLSLKEDHESQLLYFSVDRFYDNIDLSNTVCVIQYETIHKDTKEKYKGVYFVPLYDLLTLADEEKMILVWQIKNSVSQSATVVSYNFRFYKLDSEGFLEYNLNTLPTTSKILDTLTPKSTNAPSPEDSDEEIKKWKQLATEFEELYDTVHQALQWNKTYWEILE